ncbi:hypothetical protein [Paraburkholderia bryophila]|uniref:Uncharacterized protein n=1 Tax=Paraburkholderia bryophila TaxID=420952 RepID=A0A7Z0B7D1_9BURK|nr:hypothetical protein [Paraburkholderia bryophila]NYH24019.1 hypothetical protein [Paraburkholderia bryophila]
MTSSDASEKTVVSTLESAESEANEFDYSASRRREDFHEKTGELHKEVRHSNAKAAASYKPAYTAARNDRIPGAIDSTIATQALLKPSAATPVRAVSQPPRSASATESSGTSETEWMNHLSQRRVTDIPDQFSK